MRRVGRKNDVIYTLRWDIMTMKSVSPPWYIVAWMNDVFDL